MTGGLSSQAYTDFGRIRAPYHEFSVANADLQRAFEWRRAYHLYTSSRTQSQRCHAAPQFGAGFDGFYRAALVGK